MSITDLGLVISGCIYLILLTGSAVLGSEEELDLEELVELELGDLVRIAVSMKELEAMQGGHGDYNEDMAQDIGRIGEVTKVRRDGDVAIRFQGSLKSWIMNPKVLSKKGVLQGVDDTSLLHRDSTESSDQFNTNNVHLPEPRSLTIDSIEEDELSGEAQKYLGALVDSDEVDGEDDNDDLYDTEEDETGDDETENKKDDEEKDDRKDNEDEEDNKDRNDKDNDEDNDDGKDKYDDDEDKDDQKDNEDDEDNEDRNNKDDDEGKYDGENKDVDGEDMNDKDDDEEKYDGEEKDVDGEDMNNKDDDKDKYYGEDKDDDVEDTDDKNYEEEENDEEDQGSVNIMISDRSPIWRSTVKEVEDGKVDAKDVKVISDRSPISRSTVKEVEDGKVDAKDVKVEVNKDNIDHIKIDIYETEDDKTKDDEIEKNPGKEIDTEKADIYRHYEEDETNESKTDYKEKDTKIENKDTGKNKDEKDEDKNENKETENENQKEVDTDGIEREEHTDNKEEVIEDKTGQVDEKECPSSEFRCSNGECIPKNMRCNGRQDCPKDIADEENCTECQEDVLNCGDGNCIPKTWKCDGAEDCKNGRDEVDCSSEVLAALSDSKCGSTGWECYRADQCIPRANRCNGDMDCEDGSDEVNCTVCRGESFNCDNGECVPYSWRCDGEKDCVNGHDEKNCDKTKPGVCLQPGSSCTNNGTCRKKCKKGECENGLCAGSDCKCCLRTSPMTYEDILRDLMDKELVNCGLTKAEASGSSAYINLVRKGTCDRKCIKLLMNRGADINANVMGKTALWYAINQCENCKKDACAQLLVIYGSDIEDAFHGPERTETKICDKCFKLFKKKKNVKPFVNVKNKDRRTGCKVDGKLYKNGVNWEKDCCLYTCSNGRLEITNVPLDRCKKPEKRCACCQTQ